MNWQNQTCILGVGIILDRVLSLERVHLEIVFYIGQ